MPRLRVHNLAISLDGYAAGPNQSPDNPLGVGGPGLHEWVFATRTARHMFGMDGGDEGLDGDFVAQGDLGIGATIMGRNMFGPIRGAWENEKWNGWWGDDPPYHHPVFVLTHHPRRPITMQGGTTFHFVDDGIEAALEQAFNAADGNDVRIGGGASTIQQYLRARLIDDMHLVIVPILLGSGERLFDHLDGGPDGYECVGFISSPSVAHVRVSRMPNQGPARVRIRHRICKDFPMCRSRHRRHMIWSGGRGLSPGLQSQLSGRFRQVTLANPNGTRSHLD